MSLVAALLLSVSLFTQAATVCTVGSGAAAWTGSPADLASIEAVHQRESAEAAGRAFTEGAPTPSPWSALVVCTRAYVVTGSL